MILLVSLWTSSLYNKHKYMLASQSPPYVEECLVSRQRKGEIKASAYKHDTWGWLFRVEKVSMKAGAEGRMRIWYRREMQQLRRLVTGVQSWVGGQEGKCPERRCRATLCSGRGMHSGERGGASGFMWLTFVLSSKIPWYQVQPISKMAWGWKRGREACQRVPGEPLTELTVAWFHC